MAAVSSMSTVAGYKAVLMAAAGLGKFFPLLMTAAGTIAPARVFVLGAGVAGLQAIATARRLGAVVEAFDVRPAVREEVQSLGASFVQLDLTDATNVGAGGYAKELAAGMREHASQMYSRNVSALLNLLAKQGELALDFTDEITKGCCITHGGRRLLDATGKPLTGGAGPAAAPAAPAAEPGQVQV